MASPATPIRWTPFECDGCAFEYLVMPTREKERHVSWPAHKPAPGPWVPVIAVMVRKPGDENGAVAQSYPDGTVATVAHAVETARIFWATLTR